MIQLWFHKDLSSSEVDPEFLLSCAFYAENKLIIGGSSI